MPNTETRTWIERLKRGEADAPLWTLSAILALTIGLAALYGRRSPQLPAELLIAVLAAAVLAGALPGFLFGLPRLHYAPDSPKGTTDAGAEAPGPSIADRPAGAYTPSTNLDEIANWLTKIIIGATLVQIKDIGRGLHSVAVFVVGPCTPPACSPIGVPFVTALIVIAFITGLLFGYLWTRLHYGGIAASADRKIFGIMRKELDSESRYGIGGGPAPKTAGASGEPMLDSADRGATDTMNASSGDPNKGRFGGSPVANNRILSARFAPAESRPGVTKVTLTISSPDTRNPLNGNATFVLHPTFKQRRITCPIVNGQASITVLAWGAFTVGALVDEDNTKLELDLAELTEAPLDFRLR